MSIILVDTFYHLSLSHPYTELLEHYSVQISQPVSILFVISIFSLYFSYVFLIVYLQISYSLLIVIRHIEVDTSLHFHALLIDHLFSLTQVFA